MTKIGILVVAYNAASTLAQTLDRIPAEFRGEIHEVLVGDDHSQDSTHLVALGYQQISPDLPAQDRSPPREPRLRRQPEVGLPVRDRARLGRRGAPPRRRPVRARAAAVDDRADRRGTGRGGVRLPHHEPGRGPPGRHAAYKFVGNRILTTFQNAVVGTDLTEWHSGYRAYDVRGAREAPARRERPTASTSTPRSSSSSTRRASGSTRSRSPPTTATRSATSTAWSYAKDVTKDVLRYRAHKLGFGTGETAFADQRLRRQGGGRLVPRPDPGLDEHAAAVADPRPRLLRRRARRPSHGDGPRGGRRRLRGAQGRAGEAHRLLPGGPRGWHPRRGRRRLRRRARAPTCSSTCGPPSRCSTAPGPCSDPGGA